MTTKKRPDLGDWSTARTRAEFARDKNGGKVVAKGLGALVGIVVLALLPLALAATVLLTLLKLFGVI